MDNTMKQIAAKKAAEMRNESEIAYLEKKCRDLERLKDYFPDLTEGESLLFLVLADINLNLECIDENIRNN